MLGMTVSKLEGVGDGSEAPDADGSRGLVLLVDDEPTIVRGFARILTSAGFSVQIAHDGREAAELARGMSFDAIVSDIAMPEMTGLQLLRSVREHDLDVPRVLAVVLRQRSRASTGRHVRQADDPALGLGDDLVGDHEDVFACQLDAGGSDQAREVIPRPHLGQAGERCELDHATAGSASSARVRTAP